MNLNQQFLECSTKVKQADQQVQTANAEKTKLNTELEALRSKNTELSSTLVKIDYLIIFMFFRFRKPKN